MKFGRTGKGFNKFGAKKTTYKGATMDSGQELSRYLILQDMQKNGEISHLRRQVKFIVIPKLTRVDKRQLKTKVKDVVRTVELEADYHCDFVYKEGDKYIIEEYKSIYTAKLADYILRRKLMVKKVQEHNAKGRTQWVFREVIYKGKSVKITDKY